MNAANAQAIVDAELEAIGTEQATVFDAVEDEATLISGIAKGKAQIRASIEADCRAIAAIKRGKELAQPKPLTREMVVKAHQKALGDFGSLSIHRLHAALVEQMK